MNSEIKRTFLAVILLTITQCAFSQSLISYEEGRSDSQLFADQIVAHVDGLDYIINPSSENRCLVLLEQRDFDGNGTTDALVKVIKACGSSGSPNELLVITMNDIGYFTISNSVGDLWLDPILEEKEGKVIITFIDAKEDSDFCEIEVYKKRYTYDGRQLNCIENSRKSELSAIKEFRSKEFLEGDMTREEEIRFDIDGDNRLDTIKFGYWHRWGRMYWTMECSSAGHIEGDYACKRFGILNTITNGMRDIVMDSDEILVWSEGNYVREEAQNIGRSK